MNHVCFLEGCEPDSSYQSFKVILHWNTPLGNVCLQSGSLLGFSLPIRGFNQWFNFRFVSFFLRKTGLSSSGFINEVVDIVPSIKRTARVPENQCPWKMKFPNFGANAGRFSGMVVVGREFFDWDPIRYIRSVNDFPTRWVPCGKLTYP